MRISVLRAAAVSPLFSAMLLGPPVHAQQLEIKEPTVAAGEVEIEYVGGYHVGRPGRRSVETSPGSLLFDDNEVVRQQHSIGIGWGLTSWLGLEMAMEAEEGRLEAAETLAAADAFGDLVVSEIELAGTVVLLPAGRHGLAAAALVQQKIALERGEAHQFMLGAALQYAHGPWSATANLYAVRNFAGREERDDALISDDRWDFQYAAQIKYRAGSGLALGLEAFGVVERIGNSGTKSDERALFGDFDRHLVGPVAYFSWGADRVRTSGKAGGTLRVRPADAADKNGEGESPGYSLGAGVLFGLNENTSDVVFKWRLGVEF